MGKQRLSAVQGETWVASIVWTNDGVPVNITGYTLTFTLKSRSGQVVSGSVLTTDNPTAGEMEARIPALVTSGMSGAYSYSMKATTGSTVNVLAYGDIHVDAVP